MKEEFGAILRMRATEVEADNEPGVEQVLAYLARDPDFFLRHDAILAELDRSCAAEEASPVLRVIKRTFRPSREEQYRKRLKKAFDAYSGAWRARAAS